MKTRSRIDKGLNHVSLIIDNVTLKLSNFFVIPFDHNHFQNDEDIMHCTYDLELKCMLNGVEHLIHSSTAYEFGAMPVLEKNLDSLLHANVLQEGMCRTNADGSVCGVICGHSYGFFREDNYLVNKYYEKDETGEEFEWYDVTLTIGGDQDCFTSYGAHFAQLKSEDIAVMRNFAHECVELAKRLYARGQTR